jgi:hypothetical protein
MVIDLIIYQNGNEEKVYSFTSKPHAGKNSRLMDHIVNSREWNTDHFPQNMEKKLRVCILFSPRTFAAMATARNNIYMVRLC